MSYWLTNPQLFLYAKGTGPNDVHLRRCKKPVSSSSSSSSLVVPMKPDDFEYVETVKNHIELIGDIFAWDETDYNRLVKYIYEKRLLVNSQGFVIAELLHKLADKDGNKTTDGANEEDVPAIYIRSLDVLPLKPYIPNLREQPIPLRMVKYLGDINGKAAPMEEDSTVTKLTARVDHLEAENIRLESKNNTLDSNVKTLEAKNNTLDSNVKTLEAKNNTLDSNVKTLKGKVTKLTADLVTKTDALATVQHELDRVKKGKEVWMNDLTNNYWVSFEAITFDRNAYNQCTIIKPRGTFTVDDRSTNVRATYWFSVRVRPSDKFTNTAVCLEDLISNKEKARFSPTKWRWYIKQQGKTYVLAVETPDS